MTQLSYSLRISDLMRFNAFTISRSGFVKILSVLLGGFVAYVLGSEFWKISSPARAIILTVFCSVVSVIFIYAMSYVLSLASMVSPMNRSFLAPRTFEVTEDGFVITMAGAKTECDWSVVQGIAFTKTLVLLYLYKEAAVIVPSHAFADKAGASEFREYVRARVPDKVSR